MMLLIVINVSFHFELLLWYSNWKKLIKQEAECTEIKQWADHDHLFPLSLAVSPAEYQHKLIFINTNDLYIKPNN